MIQEEFRLKITTFNPMIVTKDAAPIIALFEALGFEQRHHKTGINDSDIHTTRMTDASGFHVDVAEAHVERDITTIRMNVDDFDEAREMLESHGFTPSPAGIITDASSKSIGMFSPSGFSISLVHHIKG